MAHSEEVIKGGSVDPKCKHCGVVVEPKICRSAAGFYVGTGCNCGPYTRESRYFATTAEAQEALASGKYRRL